MLMRYDLNSCGYVQIIGQKFIEKQIEVYNGTDHVYNADVFNEEKPPEYSRDYMYSSSKNIFQTMQAGDPDAVWVLQGWTFLQNFWNETLMKAWLSGTFFLLVGLLMHYMRRNL